MNGDMDPQITRLSSEVAELRSQLEAAGTDVDKLARGLQALAEQITDRIDGQAEAEDVQDPAAAAGGDEDKGKTAPRGSAWVDMTGAAAPDYLREVAEWVRTVGPHQDPPMNLVPCWYRHPAVVQMLSDLRVYWLTVYRSDSSTAWLLLDWHMTRWPEMSKRIGSLLQRCGVKHDPGYAPERVDVQAASLEQYAQQWGQQPERPSDSPD